MQTLSGIFQDTFLSSLVFYFMMTIIVGYIVYTKRNYREDLSYITGNIILLYRNFFHWNLHKIVISLYTLILALFIGSPFLSLIVYLTYKASLVISSSDLSTYLATRAITPELVSSVAGNIWLFLWIIILFIIILLVFILAFSYSFFLQQIVCKSYTEGERLPILNKIFVDYKMFYMFFKLTCWVSLYLLMPVFTGIAYILVLALISFIPGAKEIIFSENIFVKLLQTSVPIVLFGWLLYLSIRLSFSFLVLIHKGDTNIKAKAYINEALAITKNKILKIAGLGFPFLIIYMIIRDIEIYIGNTSTLADFMTMVANFFLVFGVSYMVFVSIYKLITSTASLPKIETRKIEKMPKQEKLVGENKIETPIPLPIEKPKKAPIKKTKKPATKKVAAKK